MPYVNSKNGFRMYVPQWQMERGGNMKKLNAAAVTNSASGALFGTIGDHSAGMAAIITQITVARIQAEAKAKVDKVGQVLNGLDTTA